MAVPRALQLSIVIPAYNEELRLGATLESIRGYAKQCGFPIEVLVVDDGSTDRTAALVGSFAGLAGKVPLTRLLSLPANRGKGAALRKGVLAAAGDFVLCYDADAATPIDEVDRFMLEMAGGVSGEHADAGGPKEIVIGSRRIEGAGVQRSGLRDLCGRIFCLLGTRWLLPGLADTQCGFKLFRREVARSVFSRAQLQSFATDVEVLYLARQAQLRISELPVRWREVEGSKLRLGRDSWRMMRDVLRVRRLHGAFKPEVTTS